MSGKNAKINRAAKRLILQNQARLERDATEQQQVLHLQTTVTNTRIQLALPPAEELARYERIQAGLAHRIISMAEEQGKHRRELEAKVTTGNVDAQRRGQWFALVVALAVLGVAFTLLLTGHMEMGAWILAAELLALSVTFLGVKAAQVFERVRKAMRSPPPA